jgi:hypothetical protein
MPLEQTLTPDIQLHLDNCTACAAERRVMSVLRTELVVEAPPELSLRLLALAAPQPQPARLDMALKMALVVPPPPDLSRQLLALAGTSSAVMAARRRWITLVYAATAILLAVVLMFAGQIYGMAIQELGLGEVWSTVTQLSGQWTAQFYASFPQGHYLVDAFLSLQRALQWVLVGLVMWAVLEMRAPRRAQVHA